MLRSIFAKLFHNRLKRDVAPELRVTSFPRSSQAAA